MSSTGNVDNAGNVNYTTPIGGPDKSDGDSKLKGTKVRKFSFSKLFGHKKRGIGEPKLLNNRENKVISRGIGNLMNKYKNYITPGSSEFNQEVFDFMRGLGSTSAILDEDHAKELFDKIDTKIQEIISPSSTGEQGLKNLLKSLGQEFKLDLSPLLKGGNCTGISESANNMLKPLVNVFINRAKQKPFYSFDKNSNEAKSLKDVLKNCPRSAATSQPDPTLTPAKPDPEVAATPDMPSETTPAAQPEVKSASVQSEAPKVETAVGTSIQSDTEGEYNIDNAVNALENSLSKEMASRKTSNNYGLDIGNLRNVISDLRNQKNGDKLKELENLVKQFNTRLNNENLHQQTQGRPRLLSRDAGTINRFILSLKNESTPKADSNPEASTVTAQPESTPAPAKPEPGITATLDAPSETIPTAQPEIGPASDQPEKAKPRDTDVSGAASEPKKEEISSSGDKKTEVPGKLSFNDLLKRYNGGSNTSATEPAPTSNVGKMDPKRFEKFNNTMPKKS